MIPAAHTPGVEAAGPPHESCGKLFLRFLRFGLLAWGGPIAQIDMLRHELVTRERWITPDRFRRLLAVYQALPGPEATELCVHFGVLARGRRGGVLAGLGFMLPGFVLIFLLSWLYMRIGLGHAGFQAAFLGVQPAVIALIARACHRLTAHALVDTPLAAIAVVAAIAEAVGVAFWFTLPCAGLAYLLAARRQWRSVVALGVVFALVIAALSVSGPKPRPFLPATPAAPSSEGMAASPAAPNRPAAAATPVQLFGSGLRAGLLTFGGAYTAIPFLERDAVERGGWMTQREFLDGVALAGILPAPLIIFATFIGFFAGGPWGAIAITLGVFLPAFSFALLFQRRLEAVVQHGPLRNFLEGVTAAVVGIIAVTALRLAGPALGDGRSIAICAAALIVLYAWKSKAAVPATIFGAGLAGWIFAAV